MAGVHLPRSTSSPTPWPLTCPCLLQAAACPALGTAGGAGVLPTMGWQWVPVPVRRYPRVGNHDGLQVEAPVAQIPAERGGRAVALGNSSTPSTCPPVSQAAAQWRCQESKLPCRDPGAAGTARAPWHGRVGEAAMLRARRGAHTGTGWLGAAPSQWLLLDVAASISNRISSQQLHFKAFHSAALME